MFHRLNILRQDERGAVAVLWALVLPVVIGAVALGTDVSTWYYAKRNLQNTTDAAAVSAGYDITGSQLPSTLWYTASREFTRHGYNTGGDVTLTVNTPPQSGSYTGSDYAVEVIAVQPQVRYFSRALMANDPNTTTRAVALRQPSKNACVLALESLGADALLFQGNATINLNNCVAAANSTNASAIDLNGSSVLNAESIYTAGNYDINGAAALHTVSPPVTHAQPITDPFAGLSVPSYSGCKENNLTVSNTRTLTPGVYCNGVRFNANAVVTMSPGVYIMDRDEFRINGGAQVTGTDVTIILTSSTGSDYATMRINGGANVTLSAPASGTYAGVLFYQDQNAPVASNTNFFNGGSTMNLTGAIYIPKQELQFNGNSMAGSGACTRIVARIITFSGNSNMSNNCPAGYTGIDIPGTVQLVE